MTVELKVFGGAYFPKDKALKKLPDLKPLAIAVKAVNKGTAETIIAGKLAEYFPTHTEDYFKAKVWEDRAGLPRPAQGEFCTDFFDTLAVWNAETGEPESMLTEPEMGEEETGDASANKTLPVSGMSSYFQAASLALFGPLQEVTSAQYGQIVDLTIDDGKSPERELYEALTDNLPVLQLYPEKQVALLEWVRSQAKFGAQWPAYSKLIQKWLSTSPNDLPTVAPNVGTNDETKPPVQSEAAASADDQQNEDDLHAQTDAILATERGEYVSGISDPDATNWVHEDFGQTASNEVEKTEVAAREDSRLPMSGREIEIAHALNDLFSGRTNIIGKEEVKGLVACTGHLIPDIFPLLVADIITTEFCLSPDFSNEETQDVATTILESWSDDINIRQKLSLDAIVEDRNPVPPKQPAQPEPVTIINNTQLPAAVPADLTWHQRLIIAAVQGMCANPAYSGIHDDIPGMAVDLASGVLRIEELANE